MRIPFIRRDENESIMSGPSYKQPDGPVNTEVKSGLTPTPPSMAATVVDFATGFQLVIPHPDNERAKKLIDFHVNRAVERINRAIEREMEGIEPRAQADYFDGGEVHTTVKYPRPDEDSF